MIEDKGFSGPHLSAAFLCERVLMERDGVGTFVRVVDRFTIHTVPPLPPGVVSPPAMPQVVQANLVVSLKAGDLKAGKYQLLIRLQKPDGKYSNDNRQSVFFNGSEDSGAAVVMPIVLQAPEEGLFWFEVYFESALLTKIPMRILHQTLSVQFQQAQG